MVKTIDLFDEETRARTILENLAYRQAIMAKAKVALMK